MGCRYRGLPPQVFRQSDICIKSDAMLVQTHQCTSNIKRPWAFVAEFQKPDFHIFRDILLFAQLLASGLCLRQIIKRCVLNPPATILKLLYFDAGIANQNPIDDKLLIEYQAVNRHNNADAFGSDQAALILTTNELRTVEFKFRTAQTPPRVHA